MNDATLSRQFLTIIGSAVDTLDSGTISERRQVYRHARRTIVDSLRGQPGLDVRRRDHTLSELERAIAEVENERLARDRLRLRTSQSLSPDLVAGVTGAPTPELTTTVPPRTQDRTKLFLKNVGAGSTVSLIKIAIQLALLPIMAHLLGPAEFGLYALAGPVVAFLVTIADGGVGLSLAKDRTNSPAVWSTAFWALMASGLTLAVVVNIAGYLLARASSEPRIQSIMLILSVAFPFLTASVLPAARLTRSGNLVSYSIADFSSTVVSAVTAVTLGVLGFGATSLACQYAVNYVTRAVILNYFAFERPRFVFRPSEIRGHMLSGGILMGGRIGDLICRSGENLIFGKVFGAASLGAYTFANQVPRFMFEAFSNPSWAALYAQSISEKHNQLMKIYYKVCRFMAFVTFPVAAVLAAIGPQVMARVLGPKWLEAGTFIQILAPGYALSITATMGTALLLALNANAAFFLVTVGLGVGRLVAVATGYVLPAVGSVALVTVVNVAFSLVLFSGVKRYAGAEFSKIVREMYGSFVASCLAGLICWSVVAVAGNGLLGLALAILTSAVAYLTIMFVADRKNILGEIEFLKRAAGIGQKTA